MLLGLYRIGSTSLLNASPSGAHLTETCLSRWSSSLDRRSTRMRPRNVLPFGGACEAMRLRIRENQQHDR
jgi:hypothetical protein